MATDMVSVDVVSGNDILATDLNNLRDDVVRRAGDYETAGGSSNAFTLAIDSSISAYAAGQVFRLQANHTITGTATLNVNSIGAQTIKKGDGTANLESNDIVSGQEFTVVYDGVNFQLVSTPATLSNWPSYQHVLINVSMANHSYSQFAFSPDGLYAYFAYFSNIATNNNVNVVRYTVDGLSKILYFKSSVSLTAATYSWNGTGVGITVGDTYVWICGATGSNTKIARLNADLTNPQGMTISGTAYTGDVLAAAGDDADLYLKSEVTAAQILHYSIAGTTATRTTDITLSASGSVTGVIDFDGTSFFQWNGDDLNKYNAAGTLQSTTPITLGNSSNNLSIAAKAEMTTLSRVGIATHVAGSLILTFHTVVNETNKDSAFLHIYRVTKP